MITSSPILSKFSPEQKFMISAVIVNAGNYAYNLILGRILGPQAFSDVAIIITFLLVLSFAAMTFQLATAKFYVLFEHKVFKSFISLVYKWAVGISVVFGILIVSFASWLQDIFQTSTPWMFRLFGIGVPIYFIMSIHRGVFQGQKKFGILAITYQSEMISRLIITLLLLLLFATHSSIVVVIGVICSLVCGLLPFPKNTFFVRVEQTLSDTQQKHVFRFFILTAFYELTQIIINNSDILMVKHYFDAHQAGLYASLALIGRVVYFVAWMFVMLLLPKVVALEKEQKASTQLIFKYIGYISLLSIAIVAGCYLFPKLVINIMFGPAYLSIAPLLWKYAVATSIFAIANIFAYYFLSLDRYVPVIISGVLGISQVVLIVFFHDSLLQVVLVQIVAMLLLLCIQVLYFIIEINRKRR